jgi:hypothetical protein
MLDPGQREILRIQVAKELVIEAQKDPDNLTSQATLELFSKVNTVLVEDNPPLTQQMVDAYFEICEFYSSIYLNEKIRFSDQEREEFTQQLVRKYPTLPQAQKELMNKIDVEWAKLRYTWAKFNYQERENARRRILARFNINRISQQERRAIEEGIWRRYKEPVSSKIVKKEFNRRLVGTYIFNNTLNTIRTGTCDPTCW